MIETILTDSPAIGQQAPDFSLDTLEGGKISLQDLQAKRTLIIFQRHLGCSPCTDYVSQLSAHYAAIKAAGAEVLLISFYLPDRTRNWARTHKLPYLLASDTSREVYFRYGLDDAEMIDLIGPDSIVAGAKAFFHGKIAKPSEFYRQKGGYFVVDDTGKVVYSYPSKGPADKPDIRELLGALGVR